MGVNADTSTSARRRAKNDPNLSATSTSGQEGAESGLAPESGSDADVVSGLHLRLGNSVVEAALAGADGWHTDVAGSLATGIMGMGQAPEATPNHQVAARVHRHGTGDGVGAVLDTLSQSSGFGLQGEDLERFEEAFDHDFGHVRIHTDGVAAEASKALHAYAFALGSDLYFASGNFAPGTKKGDQLLAHELTHVLQHDENRLPAPSSGDEQVSSPSDPTEREAYANEKVIMGKLARIDQAAAVEVDHEAGQAPGLLGQLELGQGAALPPAVLDRLVAQLGEGMVDEMTPEARSELLAAAQALGAGAYALDEGALQGLMGQMHDLSEGMAERTRQLVGRLSHVLGITSSVDVQVDAEAAARVAAEGASGLMEKGAVLLDPQAFDPETRSGRELLAHEMVHVAQDQLRVDGSVDQPGVMAEAEAHVLAADFVAGREVSAPTMGIPAAHVAADTGLGAADLQASLDGFKSGADEIKGAVPDVGNKAGTKRDTSATEDSDKKLSQYEDGVDGIFDQIGDLGAFDDLVDAIDDEKKSEIRSALDRIKGNSKFKQLTNMWQGAKDGGAVAGQMKRSFDNEWDGRGWGADTEAAFAMVARAAKAEAKRSAEAEKGLADKAQADAGAAAAEQKEGQKGEGGAAAGEGKGGTGAEGQLSAINEFANVDVPKEVPAVAGYDALEAITDADLGAITAQYNHQQGLSESFQAGEQPGRGSQVFETIGKNFGPQFLKSMTDQFTEGLVSETLSGAGDKLLGKMTGGRLNTPLIGPAISAYKLYEGGWDGFTSGLGETTGRGLESLGRVGETLGQLGQCNDPLDYVGVVCAALADIFGGIRDLLDTVQQIINTLSTLCFVVGGILIVVGIALAWLGVGAGLITAGGWLTRAGNILGRVGGALDKVLLVLGGLEMLFRTIAAFTVPAHMYAQQLELLGQSSGLFGERAGAKVGDKAAEKTKNVAVSVKDKILKPTEGSEAGDSGADDGVAAGEAEKKRRADLEELKAKEAEALEADAKKQRDEGGDAPQEGGEGGEAPAEKGFREKVKETLGSAGDWVMDKSGVTEVIDASKEFTNHAKTLSDPVAYQAAAAEGLGPVLRGYEERTKTMEGEIQHLESLLANKTDGFGPQVQTSEIANINKRIDDLRSNVAQQQNELTLIKGNLGTADGMSFPFGATPILDSDAPANADAAIESVNAKRKAASTVTEVEAEAKKSRAEIDEKLKDTDLEIDMYKKIIAADPDEAKNETSRADAAQQELDKSNRVDEPLYGVRGEQHKAQIIETNTKLAAMKADSERAYMGLQGFKGDEVQIREGAEIKTAQVEEVSWDGITVTVDGRQAFREFGDVQGTSDFESAKNYLIKPDTGDRKGEHDYRPEGFEERIRQGEQELQKVEAYPEKKQALEDRVTETADDSSVKLLETSQQKREALISERQKVDEYEKSEIKRLDQESGGYRKSQGKHEKSTSGKAIADLLEKPLFNAMSNLDSVQGRLTKLKGLAPGKAGSSDPKKQGGQDADSFGGWAAAELNLVMGWQPESPKQLRDAGKRQAEFEVAMEMAPPHEITELSESRKAAKDANLEYQGLHAAAYTHSEAEKAVMGMAAESKAMAESGAPVVAATKQQQAGVGEGKAEASKRDAVLGSADSNAAPAEGGMSSLVADLVTKMASHNDRMSSSADPGSGDSGAAMAGAQDMASDESKKKTEGTKNMANEQRQFLDSALQRGSEQEVFMNNQITSLEDKSAQETEIGVSIQTEKANLYAQSQNKKAEAEKHTGDFNSKYAEMKTWSLDYKARHESLK